MEGKEKGRKKGRKESSFPSPEWCPSSLLGKERNPQNPSVFKGKGEGRKGKKRRKGWLWDKIFKRDSGEKGWKKGKKKKGKNALFQSFRGAFLSPEERRNPVVSREGERKEEREKR